MTISALLVILASALAGQQATPPKPALVSGRVIHAGTGEPLRKATVSLIPAGEENSPRTMTSTPEGTFQFTNVSPGKYQVSAQRTGFLSQRAGSAGRSAPSSITVTAGQEVTNIELKLTPHGVIAGRVVDADGDPVQGVQIGILRAVSQGGKMSLNAVQGAMTNDLGDFRAAGLPQGRYYVTATAPRQSGGYRGPGGPGRGSRLPEGQKEDWVLTYFPSSVNTLGASPIEVRAGSDSSGINIQLRRAQILQVRGQVSGNPGQRLTLMLMPGERKIAVAMRGPNHATSVGKDGTFAFRTVTPGSYQLIAQRMDRRPVTLARMPVQVGTGDVDGLVVRLQEPVAVAGTLKFENATTAPADMGSARLYLQPADGGSGMRDSSVEGKLQPNGAFAFSGVSIDRMILYPYNLADGVYLRSVKMGNQEMIDTGIDLATAGPQVQLEATLATNGGSLTGKVMLDGKPAPNYTVTVYPEQPRPFQPWLTRTATTDANGNFAIRTVAPGEYRALAWEEIAREFLSDTEFLKRFEAAGPRITVKESTAQTIELTPVNTTESK